MDSLGFVGSAGAAAEARVLASGLDEEAYLASGGSGLVVRMISGGRVGGLGSCSVSCSRNRRLVLGDRGRRLRCGGRRSVLVPNRRGRRLRRGGRRSDLVLGGYGRLLVFGNRRSPARVRQLWSLARILLGRLLVP